MAAAVKTRPRAKPREATPIRRRSPSPRYYQVYVALRSWVRDGTYGPGAQIPTESELCRQFGVSRITVRKAVDDLVREGWLVRHQGRGTFVDMSAARGPASLDLTQVMSQAAEFAKATEVRDLRVTEMDPDDETLASLQLLLGQRVQKATHVRLLNGVPLGHITTWVPMDVARRAEEQGAATEQPLFELIERAGFQATEADQWIGAALANIEHARVLDIEVGAPLLRLQRVVYDVDGRPIERVIALYRADAYHYRMHLMRPRKKPARRKARRK